MSDGLFIIRGTTGHPKRPPRRMRRDIIGEDAPIIIFFL